jgi:hypothetical protein
MAYGPEMRIGKVDGFWLRVRRRNGETKGHQCHTTGQENKPDLLHLLTPPFLLK